MKSTLFISYSHESIDRDKLDYLVDQIKKKGKGAIRVLMDMHDVRLGGSFIDYMNLIETYSVDAVLLALTPSYKNKVERNEGSVPIEFKAIYQRFSDDRDNYKNQEKSDDLMLYESFRKFGLLPVILSGSQKESVPSLLQTDGLRFIDISPVVVHPDKESRLSALGQGSKMVDDLVNKIIVELKNISKNKDADYQERRNRIRSILFAKTKAGTDTNLEAEVFTRTLTYEKVLNQDSQFIVGRKGSGKSTLTEQLTKQNPNKYSTHIKIDFSKIHLSFIYSYYTDPQFRSEAETTLGYRAEYLSLVWECFFWLGLLWHERQEPAIGQFLSSLLDDNIDEYKSCEFYNFALSHSIEQYRNYLHACITKNSKNLSIIQAQLTPRKFVRFVISKALIDKIEERLCPTKCLITLDGIDSAFHDYRLEYLRFEGANKQYIQDRALVEIDLVKALMRLIASIKNRGGTTILSEFDYCITIPLDLFQEVKFSHERDSYQYLASCRPLDWSGQELAVMLRKRLEKLTNKIVDKETFYDPKPRLTELLHEAYPTLPKEITITIGSRSSKYPIFIYVLRHTFWRPREIIFHFLALITGFEYFKKSMSPITEDDLKSIVKDQAKSLIRSEFIDEFKSTITNIENIVSAFRLGPQYYSYKDFLEKLSTIPFHGYITPHENSMSADESKFRLLYEIGFVGLRLTEAHMLKHSRPKNIFSFSEGMVALEDVMKDGVDEMRVCIHPAFIEFLSLTIDPEQEVCMDIDFEYLKSNELRRNASLAW